MGLYMCKRKSGGYEPFLKVQGSFVFLYHLQTELLQKEIKKGHWTDMFTAARQYIFSLQGTVVLRYSGTLWLYSDPCASGTMPCSSILTRWKTQKAKGRNSSTGAIWTRLFQAPPPPQLHSKNILYFHNAQKPVQFEKLHSFKGFLLERII